MASLFIFCIHTAQAWLSIMQLDLWVHPLYYSYCSVFNLQVRLCQIYKRVHEGGNIQDKRIQYKFRRNGLCNKSLFATRDLDYQCLTFHIHFNDFNFKLGNFLNGVCTISNGIFRYLSS